MACNDVITQVDSLTLLWGNAADAVLALQSKCHIATASTTQVGASLSDAKDFMCNNIINGTVFFIVMV